MKVTDKQIEFIIERLKEGKREVESGYFGKERDIDVQNKEYLKLASGKVTEKVTTRVTENQLRILGEIYNSVVFKRKVRFPEKFPEKLSKDKIRELGREELLKILELKVGRRLVEKVGRRLVENSLKILLIILEKPEVSKRELSEILGISDTAVDKHIKKLKDLRVIERVGPAKGGHWEVLK